MSEMISAFRPLSNAYNPRLPQFAVNPNLIMESDKVNYLINRTSLQSYAVTKSLEDQVVYRFTEPYGVEREEFHAACFPIGIEFAEICTGPPWSQGDAIDMARRKELEQRSP